MRLGVLSYRERNDRSLRTADRTRAGVANAQIEEVNGGARRSCFRQRFSWMPNSGPSSATRCVSRSVHRTSSMPISNVIEAPYANRLSVGLPYARRTAANFEGGSWYLRASCR